MKNLRIALCLGLLSVFSIDAQEKVVTSQIETSKTEASQLGMAIEDDLFMEVATNTYVSQEPQALIMSMIIPETFEQAKSELYKNFPEDFQVTTKEVKTINGKEVIHIEGVGKAQEVESKMTLYCFKQDEKTSLMFIGMAEVSADQKYKDAIIKAANSLLNK